MSNYQDLLKSVKEKVNANGQKKSSAVSRTDLEALTHGMLNTPEHTVKHYNTANKGEKTPMFVEKTPVKRYRDSLKPLVASLGVDKQDLQALDTAPISKEHAAALIELSGEVIHDYLKAGRKYAFAVTDTDETRMEIIAEQAPEKKTINRFTDDPNAPISVTKERYMAKAKNHVPYWLKSK